MVVGRAKDHAFEAGVDILLPSIPWVRASVTRAQSNRIDFGFGEVPVLTLEDVVLSKLYALATGSPRPKDMDDLQSIFSAGKTIDMAYLAGNIFRMHLVPPRSVQPFLPALLLALVRDVQRSRRSDKE